MELDDADPVAEAMDDHHRRDHPAQPPADLQTGGQRDTVQEGVDAHAGGADDPDVAVVRGGMIHLGGRLVPDVQGRHLLHGVEGQEADGGADHRPIQRGRSDLDRSGIRSKKAAPIRIPAPTAMIAPTDRVARAATMPPNRADMKAPTDTRIAVASI